MDKTEPLNQTNAVSLPDTLLQMITGMLVSRAIYVAAKLGIADLLKDGAKSSEELAKSTQVDAQSLYRVLRALASVGIFAEVENRHFGLTPLAEYLQSDVTDSMQAIAIMLGEDWHWQLWGIILYSVKTGKPAFEYIFGMPIFQYLGQNPEAAKVFDACMTSLSIKRRIHKLSPAHQADLLILCSSYLFNGRGLIFGDIYYVAEFLWQKVNFRTIPSKYELFINNLAFL